LVTSKFCLSDINTASFHIYYYPNDPADELAIDALFDEAKEKWGNDLRIVGKFCSRNEDVNK